MQLDPRKTARVKRKSQRSAVTVRSSTSVSGTSRIQNAARSKVAGRCEPRGFLMVNSSTGGALLVVYIGLDVIAIGSDEKRPTRRYRHRTVFAVRYALV